MVAPLLVDGPADAEWTLVLAHGAGAPMDTPFLLAIADALARDGIRVVRFEFPYMAERRSEGRRRPPDRMPKLLASYRDVLAGLAARRLAVGGKSLGGRVASLLAAETPGGPIERVVCLAYPFHPPGRPERVRTGHLASLATPTLIVQGTRDPFGHRDEVAGYALSPALRLHWLADGDHGFAPRKRSGHTLEAHLAEAARVVAAFLRGG